MSQERFFELTEEAINFDPENHDDETLKVGQDANVIHKHYNTSDWETEAEEGDVTFAELLEEENEKLDSFEVWDFQISRYLRILLG